MGTSCFVCGLDRRSVKLGQMTSFDEKGRETQISICEGCRPIMLKGNHPTNGTQGEPPADMPGFIKPSDPNAGGYPPVRPQ